MRTLIIIGIGFLVWAAILGLAKIIQPGNVLALRGATYSFIGAWFVAAAVNMWVGVTRAGYSVQNELPIFLLIFLLPALTALFVKWKWY